MTRPPSAGPDGGRQLLLDFPRANADQRPLIASGSYAPAVGALGRWRLWPDRQFALVGEPQSGKSRLLRWWAAQTGAALITGAMLAEADMGAIARLSVSALAIDDADWGADGHGLLAAFNMCRERQALLLVSGRCDPAGWFREPPDLCSRLSAVPVVHIEPPDDATLAARLREDSRLRHLDLPDESVTYLSARMERSWAAVARVADQIERTPGRAEGLRSARAVLVALGMDPG